MSRGAGLVSICSSGPNDEPLDVDVHDGEGRTIDAYFFARRVAQRDRAPLPRRA